MTPLSASSIASLRARTGVSILACKEALEEAQGDEEKAIELLRKRGLTQMAKKADRAQSEGLVFLKESDGKAALVLLRCETDFVARDTHFQEVGSAIATALHDQGLDAAEKLASETIPELVQKLGENISVGEMQLVEASVVGTYLHSNNKIGVVVALGSGSKEKARDAAMHAAAMNPLYAAPTDIPADVVAKEKEIWSEQLKKEGKPEAMWEKIMMGKEKKFREENALLTQVFVKDPSMSVGTYLASELTAYVRFSVK